VQRLPPCIGLTAQASRQPPNLVPGPYVLQTNLTALHEARPRRYPGSVLPAVGTGNAMYAESLAGVDT